MKKKIKNEIKIRGQIISISLILENTLERVIFNTFKPKKYNKEIKELYLKKFIRPITFSKKIEIFNLLLKTEIYQKKIINLLESPTNLMIKKRNINSNKELTNFLNKSLQDILKTRNSVAHGYLAHGLNLTNLEKDILNIEKSSYIFNNNDKVEILNVKDLKPFSEKTILTCYFISSIYFQNEK